MDVWQLIVYVVASALALRSLALLMASHKQQFEAKLLVDEITSRQEAEGQTQASDDEADEQPIPHRVAA